VYAVGASVAVCGLEGRGEGFPTADGDVGGEVANFRDSVETSIEWGCWRGVTFLEGRGVGKSSKASDTSQA
jgi:hypothetical protein